MTIFLLANSVFLILSIGYAWLAGSRLDRQAVGWIVAALLGTSAASAFAAVDQVMPIVLLVDITLLAAITSIALRSPRYWPTWFAGLHLAGVAYGFAAVLYPQASDLRVFAGLWSTLALLAMVVGLFLDRRAQIRFAG